MRRVSIFLLLVPLTVAYGCGEKSGGTNDLADAAGTTDAGAPDSQIGDAALVPDATPRDAAEWPEGTQFDFCNQPLFKLPVDSATQESYGIDIHGDRVVYSVYPYHEWQTVNGRLFDVATCTEYQFTQQARVSDPRIWEDVIVCTMGGTMYCKEIFTASTCTCSTCGVGRKRD